MAADESVGQTATSRGGKAVAVSAVHVDRVAGGLIAERWEVVDPATALGQIAATIAPPPTQLAPRRGDRRRPDPATPRTG